MREKTWLACKDPERMLTFLGNRASDRQLRLFALACVRRAWRFVTDERIPQLVTVLENLADGTLKDRARGTARTQSLAITRAKLDMMQQCVSSELWSAFEKKLDRRNISFGESAAAAFGYEARGEERDGRTFGRAKEAERAQQAALVRDIFGNPFRKVKFDKRWRTDTAVAVAKQMYESRDFGAAPILADALQDAGCDSDDLLNHLRDTSATHVRGCWALDLVLGKQ